MQPFDWTELRARQRTMRAKPENVCSRVYGLLDAIKAVEKAENDVELPFGHPKYEAFHAALEGLDTLDIRKRLEVFADAWQAEIDAGSHGEVPAWRGVRRCLKCRREYDKNWKAARRREQGEL